MTSDEEMFNKNWEIFLLTGMPWPEIKALTYSDREFMYKKSKEAKEIVLRQYNESKDNEK